MIKITCPHCDAVLSVSDFEAGHEVRCPECAEYVQVPETLPTAPKTPQVSRKMEPVPQIIVTLGGNEVARYAFPGEQVSIGRAEGNGVRLDDKSISRKHAEIRRENDRYYLIDLESRNGTLVNGSRVARVEIRDRDKIKIGEYTLDFMAPDGSMDTEGVACQTIPQQTTNEAMTVCADCGGVISRRAFRCPHCGAPTPFEQASGLTISVSKEVLEKNKETLGTCALLLPFCAAAIILLLQGLATLPIAFGMVLGCAILMAIESAKYGVGQRQDGKRGETPLGWFLGALLLYVVVFPRYFHKRGRYGLKNRFLPALLGVLVFFVSSILVSSATWNANMEEMRENIKKHFDTVLRKDYPNVGCQDVTLVKKDARNYRGLVTLTNGGKFEIEVTYDGKNYMWNATNLLSVGIAYASEAPTADGDGPVKDTQGDLATPARDSANLSDPRNVPFRVLDIRSSFDGAYISVVGEIENKGTQAMGVELEVVVRDSQGRVLDSDTFWPASVSNIPPGTRRSFKKSMERRPDAQRVDVSIVRGMVWD